MAENDQALDALEAAEPGAQPLDRRVVDLAVAGERGDRRGNETSEIKGFHVEFPPLGPMLAGSSADRGEPRADRVRRTPTERPALYRKTQIRHFRYNKMI